MEHEAFPTSLDSGSTWPFPSGEVVAKTHMLSRELQNSTIPHNVESSSFLTVLWLASAQYQQSPYVHCSLRPCTTQPLTALGCSNECFRRSLLTGLSLIIHI